MSLPTPEPGLVIRYAYLWAREYREGREEATKDRPCAIVLAASQKGGRILTLVVPITSQPQPDNGEAVEIPLAVKRALGLDHARAWVVLTESNLFEWPGPDLRFVGEGEAASVAYGFLPPRFFNALRERFLALEKQARARRVPRSE